MKRSDYISASEIGDFVYCKRGWWLKLHMLLPVTAAMHTGAELHDDLSNKVVETKNIYNYLLIGAVVLFIVLTLLFIFTFI